MVHAADFVLALRREIQERLARLGETETLVFESKGTLDVPVLLRIALRNELDAVEVAGAWLASTSRDHPGALELRLALARQAGDESRHYTLIARRLAELDAGTDADNPHLMQAPSPLTQWLLTLVHPVERMAAGPFAREALACVKNEQFIALCRLRGDVATAALYERQIQPDEKHHHELGARFLGRHCADDATQAVARAAVHRTLDLADELAHAARNRGICQAPGC
jgi:uncharacterized ferritin-like protein (DUF455 family)